MEIQRNMTLSQEDNKFSPLVFYPRAATIVAAVFAIIFIIVGVLGIFTAPFAKTLN